MWKQEIPLFTLGSVDCASDLDVDTGDKVCTFLPPRRRVQHTVFYASQISPCGNYVIGQYFPISMQDTLEN